MSERRKAPSPVFPSPVTLFTIVVVGTLFACGFMFLLFDSRQGPTETAASISSVRKATIRNFSTATLFPGAPPFPEAPTGPATLLPTVDFALIGTPPPPDETADFIEEATDNAEAPIPVVTEIPISTPPVPVTPSEKYVSFTDRNLKVSFEYPENWFVKPTGAMDEELVVQNVDPSKIGMTKGIVAVTPAHFSIAIGHIPDALEGYSSFEEWVDVVEQRVPPGNRITRVNLKNIDGHQAIQLVSTGVTDPNILFGEILIEKNQDVYSIRVIPANTKYAMALEHLLNSMRIPD